MYERVARGDPLWLVAEWVTTTGLPKCRKTPKKDKEWTEANICAAIRRTIYRALDTYRATVVEKKHRSGKKVIKKNTNPELVLTRDMPHLRIVPDWLWYKANAAIDERMRRTDYASGSAHPLFGIPRDSRSPLSKLFVCDICGYRMHMDGRNEGGYRCGQCRKKDGCWNKATAVRDFTHEQISKATSGALIDSVGDLDAYLAYIGHLHSDDSHWLDEEHRLRGRQRDLLLKLNRLRVAIENGDQAPETIVKAIVGYEEDLLKAQAELECLLHDKQSRVPLSSQLIEDRLAACSGRLLDLNREVGPMLKQLVVGKIRAVPYQQFTTNKVVLRAEFRLSLVGLFPEVFRPDSVPTEAVERLPVRDFLVDLFKLSSAPEFAVEAVQLAEQPHPKMSLVKIGKKLGIPKRQAHLAVQLGREMKAAGITDPFVRLTECPAAPSRWRRNRSAQKDEEAA